MTSTMPERIWAVEARPGKSPPMWAEEIWPVYDSQEYVRADLVTDRKEVSVDELARWLDPDAGWHYHMIDSDSVDLREAQSMLKQRQESARLRAEECLAEYHVSKRS